MPNDSKLLRGATLLHMAPPRVEMADIRIENGLITEIGHELQPRVGEQIVDLSGLWVMRPGLPAR